MRIYLYVLCILYCSVGHTQQHYNVTFDSTYISAIMQENIVHNGGLYGVGGAICSTGECGYLSRYTFSGEVLWTKEYAQIDINSGQVIHHRDDKLYITGRAKDTIATKTLVLDTLGNVLEEWNYSVAGTETNFSKEVYYDEDYYYFITAENIDSDYRGVLYKCDYNGNLIARLVFPSFWFTIPLSVRPYKDNLLISINHQYSEECPFSLNFGPSAAYLAEVDKVNMEIIRDKKGVCYQWGGNDIYITPDNEIIRTVILRDSIDIEDGNIALIFYDDDWEVKQIEEYPHDLAKGISNIKYTKNGDHYYSMIGENIEQTDGSNWPFHDFLIQKRKATHELLWEKRYTSHNTMKRIYGLNFTIDSIGNLHIVGYVWPDFSQTVTFDFWLFSVDSEGCHNGDCRDVVDLDNLVMTHSPIQEEPALTAYPNPTDGMVYLDNLKGGTPITILDSYGHRLDSIKYKKEEGIDLRSYPDGVYIIDAIGYKIQKVIKF